MVTYSFVVELYPTPTGLSTIRTFAKLVQALTFLTRVLPVGSKLIGPMFSLSYPPMDDAPGPPLSQITVGTF